jgi:anti-anti-sigma factor
MAPQQSSTLSLSSGEDCTIATIGGSLDIVSGPVLREELINLLDTGISRLVVDLSVVTFCDVSGLAVLVGAARRAWLQGGWLRLADPAPAVTAVLRRSGLDLQFETFENVRASSYGTIDITRADSAHPGVATRARRSSVAR